MSEICRCIEGSCLGLEGGNPFGICRMGNGVVKPSIIPAPVEGVVMPERIVTDHDRKAAHEYNCSPVRIGETARLKTAEECCLERLLAESIAQRDEARKDVLVEKKRIEYVQDYLRECQSKLATARAQGREEGLREALKRVQLERLDNHDQAVSCDPDVDGTDTSYSNAILDAENSILALIPKK